MLTGSTSTFIPPGYTIDIFPERKAGELIASPEWNHQGDAIYRTEENIFEVKGRQTNFRLNPEVRIWTGNFIPVWDLAAANQLTATGKIVLPVSACIYLATTAPLDALNMVKMTPRYNTPSGSRYNYGMNITHGIWCPYDQQHENDLPGTNNRFAGSIVGFGGAAISSATGGIGGINIPEIDRTIIASLYFDGFPVPTNLNAWGIICSIMIAAPETGDG